MTKTNRRFTSKMCQVPREWSFNFLHLHSNCVLVLGNAKSAEKVIIVLGDFVVFWTWTNEMILALTLMNRIAYLVRYRLEKIVWRPRRIMNIIELSSLCEFSCRVLNFVSSCIPILNVVFWEPLSGACVAFQFSILICHVLVA